MNLTGYANRFGPLRLATTIAEAAYSVAGFLLNSGKPLDDDLRRIAADVAEIRRLLEVRHDNPGRKYVFELCNAPLRGRAKSCVRRAGHPDRHWNAYYGSWSADETSAAPVIPSPNPEDAAEEPRAEFATRPGQLNVGDIPDEYWDAAK